jgi:type II secretory pathway component GspD/PulD (secretin)
MKSLAAVLMILVALPAFAAKEKNIDRISKQEGRPLTVTLDVKDAEVRDILKSLQRQCAIRNLIVDPDVQGKGTFFIHDVPCATAFDLVFRTMRLKAVTYSKTLTAVESRH